MSKPFTYRTVQFVAFLAVLTELNTSADGATLSELVAGTSISVGSAHFGNWELIGLDFTAAQGPLLSQIAVTPIADDLSQPGLLFSANGQLATAGINSLDLTIKYRVSALPPGKTFVGHSLDLTGVAFGGAAGIVLITAEVSAQAGTALGSAVTIADNETELNVAADDVAFFKQASLEVHTNIFLTGLLNTDTVNLSSFTQRFLQTGSQIVAGDFDGDGDVDGLDFLIWQRGNSPNPLSETDLAAWQANYGAAPLIATVAAIPEPEAFWLALCGGVSMIRCRNLGRA